MQEPPDWFIEPLYALHEAAIENTGIDPGVTVKCSAKFGLRLGWDPDSCGRFRTPFGIITLEVEEKIKSDDGVLREQNRSLCEALATWTARAYAAEQRCEASVNISIEAERLLTELLTNTGPERMAARDRRVLIQVMERIQRIRRLK